MLRLYDYWRSSAAYRVRIGLHLKSIAYEAVPINIMPGVDEQLQGEYLALNPQARVPLLQNELGKLGQSLAILDWMEEVQPTPSFYSGDAWKRAQIRAFALTIACDIHPLNNTSSIGRLKSQFGADEKAIASWYVHWIKAGFEALEAQMAVRKETAFVFGDEPSLADICLIPQCANARRFKFDFTSVPRIARIDERARQHPAFVAAAPENQKDAVKP